MYPYPYTFTEENKNSICIFFLIWKSIKQGCMGTHFHNTHLSTSSSQSFPPRSPNSQTTLYFIIQHAPTTTRSTLKNSPEHAQNSARARWKYKQKENGSILSRSTLDICVICVIRGFIQKKEAHRVCASLSSCSQRTPSLTSPQGGGVVTP